MTATIPGVTDCDCRSKHRIVGVVKLPLNEMTLQENKLRQKKFANEDLEIEPTSYIDDKQNVWFRGKDVATILGYSDTDKAIRNHVDEK